jgi:sec-independent protein translocase protein TatC
MADTIRETGIPGTISVIPGESQAPEPSPSGTPSPGSGEDVQVMSLVDHLVELRNRLIRVILAVLAGGIVGFIISPQVISFVHSALPTDEPLIMLGVGDAFAIRLRIALVTGIVLAMPIILYQVWAFVSPGLTPAEKRTVRPWVPMALAFFALGCTIAYVVLPFATAFLLGFATPDLRPQLTAAHYFDFVTTMFLAFGLLMEFPILLFGLSRVGIVTSARLSSSRRYAILAIAIFAAAATPGGDIISPAVLGLTMYLLFEGTVVAIRRTGR